MEILLEFMGKGIIMMLSIALPCVLTAAAIGLVVGILQAVTQVQEQTIAAAPKITAVFVVILVLGSGFVKMLSGLFTEAVQISFNVIPKNEKYVLDADYYKTACEGRGGGPQDAAGGMSGRSGADGSDGRSPHARHTTEHDGQSGIHTQAP